jgi:hypothetical protein
MALVRRCTAIYEMSLRLYRAYCASTALIQSVIVLQRPYGDVTTIIALTLCFDCFCRRLHEKDKQNGIRYANKHSFHHGLFTQTSLATACLYKSPADQLFETMTEGPKA